MVRMIDSGTAGSKTTAKASADRPPIPLWKRFCFALVTAVGFFAAVELVLYLAGVQPANVASDPFVGFSSLTPHFVEQPGTDGQPLVVLAKSKQKSFNPLRFQPHKRPGAYRIFCVGGSTTYGRPFFDATSFPGWLRALLPAADPAVEWEVINAGGISYASYRVAGVMQELCHYEPDLFVVYVGHNEFLERRTYHDILATPWLLRESASLVRRTRIAAAVDSAVRAVGLASPTSSAPAEKPAEEVKAIPVDAVGPAAYSRDERLKDQVVQQFRSSLERMVDLARQAGASILLVTPASNLTDFAPFKSQHRDALAPADLDRWQREFSAGIDLLKEGSAAAAVARFRAAEVIDDQYAALHFELGRGLLQTGDAAQAREEFVRARTQDICPLRAIEVITGTVRNVAAERGVPLADFDRWLTEHAPQHIPGPESFHDHVHPTIEANREMALQIIAALAKAHLVTTVPEWNQQAIDRVTANVMDAIDRDTHATELHQLARMLEWLGHHQQADKTALAALELSGNSAASLYQVGLLYHRQKDPETAVLYYRKAIAKRPDFFAPQLQLGIALAALGQSDAAIVHLRKAVKQRPDLPAAHGQLGLLLTQQGSLEQAKDHFATVVRLQPETSSAHSNLGLALANLGQWDKAIAQYQRALSLAPDDSSARLNYGMALEAQGQLSAAIDQYRAVLRLKPGHANARARLKALEQGSNGP